MELTRDEECIRIGTGEQKGVKDERRMWDSVGQYGEG